MELELEPCGAGAPAAGQRLLQAEAPADNEPEAVVGSRRSGRADSMLRWFITVLLCAAFLGLVRAGAGTLPNRDEGRRSAENAAFCVLVSAACRLRDLGLIHLPEPQFCSL